MGLKRAGTVFAAASVLALLASCGGGEKRKDVVVVYSPHGVDLEEEVKQAFEAAYPGRTLEILEMGGGEILSRIRGEQERPACDVWWGGAPGDFKRAEAEGLLEPYAPAWTQALPAEAKSPTGAWAGMYLTPEVIMFNTQKVKREEVPTTWEGLLDEKWKGRIVVRDVRPSATMKTIFSALIWREWKRTGDLESGFAFLEKLHASTGAYAANPQALYELLLGPNSYALTPWNMADALLQKHNHKRPFDFVLPKGTPVPVEPIALVKGGPHAEGARLFYDFVTSEEQALLHAGKFHRLPARRDLPKEKLPEWMRELNEKLEPLPLDWDELDRHQEAWIARWQSQIKTK